MIFFLKKKKCDHQYVRVKLLDINMYNTLQKVIYEISEESDGADIRVCH